MKSVYMQRPVKVRVTVSVSVRQVATFSAQLAVQCAADSRPSQRRVSVPSTLAKRVDRVTNIWST